MSKPWKCPASCQKLLLKNGGLRNQSKSSILHGLIFDNTLNTFLKKSQDRISGKKNTKKFELQQSYCPFEIQQTLPSVL